MDKPYEVATDELRQVKRRTNIVLAPYGILGLSIETTLQRKWLVEDLDGYRYEGSRRNEGDINISPKEESLGIWLPGRVEWRDLPTEWVGEKPMARAL